MKRAFVIICAALFAVQSSAVIAALPAQNLLKGSSSTIDVDYEIGDVAIADPKVCDYVIGKSRKQVYLNPREAGRTTLTMWDAGGTKRDEVPITVFTTTVSEVLKQAKDQFGSLEGIGIELKGNRIVLKGEVIDPEDQVLIDQFARTHQGVSSQVKLSSVVIETTAKTAQKAIGVTGIRVRGVGGQLVLDGVAYSAQDAKRAFEIARIYDPKVMNLIDVRETGRRIGRAPMVELDIKLMEIKKSALRTLGVAWAPGATTPSAGGSTSTGNASGLFGGIADMTRGLIGFVFNCIPRLRSLRQRGDARILENPTLIAKSGEKAEFFSGSEVPYYRNDEVQFKEVGVKITAEPIVMGNEIDLKISATLSGQSAHIDGAIDRNTVSTSAVIKRGQSVVLGGIVHNGDVISRNRVPKGVDTSTALFSLFRSRDFQSKRSEFVIIVTPRVLKQPRAADAQLQQWMQAEEGIVKARSKKEYRSYLEKRGRALPPRKRRKNKWR